MRFFVLFLTILGALSASTIPAPRLVEKTGGDFAVDIRTRVIAAENLTDQAKILTDALQKTTGGLHKQITPRQVGRRIFKRTIKLGLADAEKAEYYRIEITPDGATINGSDLAGLVYGIQTFVQMLPVSTDPKNPLPRALVPCQLIESFPATPRRAFSLNLGAHLFSTDDLKTTINWLSFHHLNELHLILNGEHGWRMESSSRPKLHEVGSKRNSTPPFGDPAGSDETPYSGFYTQENLRDLVTHAKSRGIKIIPGLSLDPGAAAIIAAYPDLGKAPAEVATIWNAPGVSLEPSPATASFLEDILGELSELFPSSEVILQIQSAELAELALPVLKKHQLTRLRTNSWTTTDFSTYSRPAEVELLVSPRLEAKPGLNPLRQVYELNPAAAAQAVLETPLVPDFVKLQHQVFPRIAAFAEATWVPQEQKNYTAFRKRLDPLILKYRQLGLSPSLIHESKEAKALAGTIVTTSLKARVESQAVRAFDGNPETFFWSAEGAKTGDHFTLQFPWEISGQISIGSGQIGAGIVGENPGSILSGLVEISPDGKNWKHRADLFEGQAEINATPGTKFVRIRFSAPQDEAIILRDVRLSESLITPKFEETQTITFPNKRGEAKITFRCDFTGSPELRDEVTVIRRQYFQNWYLIARQLGVENDPVTPREYELPAEMPGDIGPEAAKEWFLPRLVAHLQVYPAGAPDWFTTGMQSLLAGNRKGDRSKPREGGADSAAFLDWLNKKYGEEPLIVISRECRRGYYKKELWNESFEKNLPSLIKEYQE